MEARRHAVAGGDQVVIQEELGSSADGERSLIHGLPPNCGRGCRAVGVKYAIARVPRRPVETAVCVRGGGGVA